MSKKSSGSGMFLYFFIQAFFIVFVVALVVLEIWIFATYGGKPINEVPSWVHWFMFSGMLL